MNKMDRKTVATRQDEISETKRHIMTQAAALFAEKGYGSVGISEIGEVSGFGKGALYYHIGSKEELLFDIMTDYMFDLNDAAKKILLDVKDNKERVIELSRSFLDIMFRSRSEMTVCFREVHALGEEKRKEVLAMHAQYQDVWIRVLKDGNAAGDFQPMAKLQLKALLGMYFYSFLWVKTNGPVSLKSIADSFADIVLRVVKRD
jgi:TetR/AcrR family transcriptional regulator, cholesterol catabolism regulator